MEIVADEGSCADGSSLRRLPLDIKYASEVQILREREAKSRGRRSTLRRELIAHDPVYAKPIVVVRQQSEFDQTLHPRHHVTEMFANLLCSLYLSLAIVSKGFADEQGVIWIPTRLNIRENSNNHSACCILNTPDSTDPQTFSLVRGGVPSRCEETSTPPPRRSRIQDMAYHVTPPRSPLVASPFGQLPVRELHHILGEIY